MKLKGFHVKGLPDFLRNRKAINGTLIRYDNLDTGSSISDRTNRGNIGTVVGTLTNTAGLYGNYKTFGGSGNISIIRNMASDLAEYKSSYGIWSKAISGHQGIITDGSNFYVIDSQKIYKHNSAWELMASNTTPCEDAGVTGTSRHVGHGCYHDGKIYLPIENYLHPCSSFSNQRIAIFNANTLEFIEQHSVSSAGLEIAGCSIDSTGTYIYVITYCGAGRIAKFDFSTWSHLSTITISPGLVYLQGIECYNDEFRVYGLYGAYRVTLDGTLISHLHSSPYGDGRGEGGYTLNDDTYYQLFSDAEGNGNILRFERGKNGDEFTIILWVNSDYLPSELPESYCRIFATEDDNFALYLSKSSSELLLKVSNVLGSGTATTRARISQSNNLLKKNAWMMVTVTMKNSVGTIYIDDAKTSATGSYNYAFGPAAIWELTIGGSGTSNPSWRFRGDVGEFSLINHAMTVYEIKKFYKATKFKYGL